MQTFRYNGCQSGIEGEFCVVIGAFSSSRQHSSYCPYHMNEIDILIDPNTKYRVRLLTGQEVNVYGRNIREYNGPKLNCSWGQVGEPYIHPSERDVYPYVSVKFPDIVKHYYFLNADVKLRERDLVVVQNRDSYKVGMVWGVRHEDCKDHSYTKATKYVEHRVDVERMAAIEDKAAQRKEVNELISQRLSQLRNSLEESDFMQDPELAHLIAERNNLEV